MSSAYDEFLNLPHHVSADLPHMSMQNRAAQFAPFAALVGYDALIQETTRLTDQKAELDESVKAELNEKLRLLLELMPQQPEVTITYFLPDNRKAGGAYKTTSGIVRKYLRSENLLVMIDGSQIPIDAIAALDGDCFSSLEKGMDFDL